MTFQGYLQTSFGRSDLIPYDYQIRLAENDGCHSRLINIPTGLGKTAAVIHAWLWNRMHLQRPDWPRRLVYCLPMRTLVEQTYDCAERWLAALDILWDVHPATHAGKVGLHMLMGGETTARWELYPEDDAILIGTQDMLISRALNRGYGMSRFRWPMHYGLLNNDCLWIFDEVQLMGAGLPTTAQLAAFRDGLGTARPCHTWWMSATSDPAWLKTVDFDPGILGNSIELEDADRHADPVIRLREARKQLAHSEHPSGEVKKLAAEIVTANQNRSGLTFVVVNTVRKAKDLHAEITKQMHSLPSGAAPILLHSQFRPGDRTARLAEVIKSENQSRIVVSTQIVEAGVDISAATLFTEMAPWSSLVQRFGRCNRRGTETDARIFLITPDKPAPYDEVQLKEATRLVDGLMAVGADASPKNLEQIPIPACDKPVANHVIRRRDFLDLFDTTPDLAGQDIDIDRWVREIEDTGISLFWRGWEGSENDQQPPNGEEFSAPQRNELCPAPLNKETHEWLKKGKIRLRRWDHLEGSWTPVRQEFGNHVLIPGQIYLVPSHAGGYSPETGFDPKITQTVAPIALGTEPSADSTDGDAASASSWQSIAEHTGHVCQELGIILEKTGIFQPALPIAARWHDLGKVHPAFAVKIKPDYRGSPEASSHTPFGKAPQDAWRHHRSVISDPEYRSHFRHELASALAILHPDVRNIPDDLRNLVAWLVAAHHGKIRLSIRSLPDESLPPQPNRRFARGVWDGDRLDSVDLGNNEVSPAVMLSLEPMEIGLCQEPPFENQPSWAERMLELRDSKDIGPLRLAFWETLLRAADGRASANHP
ncbi:MAG: CRISPR-associated helicase Cas3' [Verrucomicrobia bacterium]|nr:CRISPR-associated helicase Cas3' [Verrucomicrobiota bacterium]